MNARSLLLPGLLFAASIFSHGEPLPRGMPGLLASEDFAEREKAQQELLGWAGEKSGTRSVALAALLSNEDPEIRKRVMEILRQLSDEDYLSDGQGYLGIMMGEEMLQAEPNGKQSAGIRISRVMKGSPADSCGLKAGDLIIALNGASWDGRGALDSFMDKIAKTKPLADVVLSIRRDAAEPFDVTVKLGKRPVPDLLLARGNLDDLDRQAKEAHFKEWLERLEADRE